MGTFPPLELTAAHLTYLLLSLFLIVYALFSVLIRNKLHLSEPPLALLTGIAFGPHGANVIDPQLWRLSDDGMQELTRVIVGLQVFAIGLELPSHYMRRHWKSVFWMLGPVMAFGWLVCAGLVQAIFKTGFATALVIGACLTPTDPVLAAAVVGNSRFSSRVPKRVKNLLSAESGCNDGVAFPFLYMGLQIITKTAKTDMVKSWLLLTIVWQCVLGVTVGTVLGFGAYHLLRFCDRRKLIGPSSFLAFYLLLAVLSIGIASTLGMDDFLVAFAAGATFSSNGWFAKRTRQYHLNNVLDLLINSSFFVLFGAAIPWGAFTGLPETPNMTVNRLILFLAMVLLLRRIPIVVALKRFIPDIKTYREALFCGHFGPMGIAGLFLALEATAFLETGTSRPLPHPDPTKPHFKSVLPLWPCVTFVVMGSTIVHGLSVAAISLYSYCTRRFLHKQQTVAETEPLHGMQHEDSEGGSAESGEDESSSDDDGWSERRRRIALPE